MKKNVILLDIMRNGRFVCQLRYKKRGYPELVDGKIVEVHRTEDIEAFVESERPSLKGTDYKIEFSQNIVFV